MSLLHLHHLLFSTLENKSGVTKIIPPAKQSSQTKHPRAALRLVFYSERKQRIIIFSTIRNIQKRRVLSWPSAILECFESVAVAVGQASQAANHQQSGCFPSLSRARKPRRDGRDKGRVSFLFAVLLTTHPGWSLALSRACARAEVRCTANEGDLAGELNSIRICKIKKWRVAAFYFYVKFNGGNNMNK